MNRILNDIQIKILNAMKENIPEVSSDALEEGGKAYYMKKLWDRYHIGTCPKVRYTDKL